MKFSTQEVMDAPVEDAFALLTQFDLIERAVMRRGVDVQRVDALEAPGVGLKWRSNFVLRGRPRTLDLEVVVYEPPHRMVMALSSQGFQGDTRVELIALSKTRTRVMVSVEVRPLSLPARLLLQSLKLTKSTLNQKYKDRVAHHIRELEEQYRHSA